MKIALIFLALGFILLIVAIVLIVLAGRTGRGRAAWARENGWEFRREDPDLAREWSNYWGTDGAASNVLSGRVHGRVAHLARIGDNSVAVLRRTGNSDVVLRMYPAEVMDDTERADEALAVVSHHSNHDRVHSAPGAVATIGGWDVVGDNALIPALDSRFETGISQVRSIGNALVVDPWWVILRTSGDLPIASVPDVFGALSLIDDACRALPSVTAEVIDFSQLDPTRAFGCDTVNIGGGPRMQVVADDRTDDVSERPATVAVVPDRVDHSEPQKQGEQQKQGEWKPHDSLVPPASGVHAVEEAFTDDTITADDSTADNRPDVESVVNNEDSGADERPDWNARPETPRQPVTLPRRDQGTMVGDDEDMPPLGDEDSDLPVVGEDPDHQRAPYRPGRVIRVQAEQYPAIFGQDQSGEIGRHRRPAARHASGEPTHPETAEIIAIHDPDRLTTTPPRAIDPANIIDTTEHNDDEGRDEER